MKPSLDRLETGPRGCLVWIEGRPSSGTWTLASAVRRELGRRAVPCVVLDGDDVRRAVAPQLGYSSADRDAFYATLARLAAMLYEQGFIVVVSATASQAAYRNAARSLVESFVEVLVDTPLEECERRDDRGLHARAREGHIADLPHTACAFESPDTVDVIARGGRDAAAVAEIVERAMVTQ